MRKKKDLKVDYLFTPFFGIFVVDGKEVVFASKDFTSRHSVNPKSGKDS